MRRSAKQEVGPLGPGKGAQTARGHRRRSLILRVAADLFAEQGFDSVSITDIGMAAEITGPAIYRYFPSKEALLVSIYEHLYQRYKEGIDGIWAEGVDEPEALRRLINLQIELATEEPEKIRIVNSEERHLPLREAKLMHEENRQLLKVWAGLVRHARPDLSRVQVDVTVHAILAMINSITFRKPVKPVPSSVREHLRAMAFDMVWPGSNKTEHGNPVQARSRKEA